MTGSKDQAASGRRYTVLPKDPKAAFRAIQEMAGEAKAAKAGGGEADNPGPPSSDDNEHRKGDEGDAEG